MPRAPSSRSQMAMASGNEPVASSKAEIMRLPSVWLRANVKRYLNARVKGSSGSAAIAAMHLRMSPGGVTLASSRRMPVEPPSSAMATMALVWAPRESSVRRDTGAPVPPPITTARTSPSDGSRPAASSQRRERGGRGRVLHEGRIVGTGNELHRELLSFPALVGLVVRHQRSVGALGQAQVAVRDAHAIAVGAQVVRASPRRSRRCGAGRPCSRRRWRAAACPRRRSPA